MRALIPLLVALVLLAGCTSVPSQQAQAGALKVAADLPDNTSVPAHTLTPPPQENATSGNDSYDFSKVYSDDGKLIIYFFYSHKCGICNFIKPQMEALGKKYENTTEWRGFDIYFKKDKDTYFQFFRDYNLSQSRSGVPTVMVNNTILWGKYEINDSLEKIIIGAAR